MGHPALLGYMSLGMGCSREEARAQFLEVGRSLLRYLSHVARTWYVGKREWTVTRVTVRQYWLDEELDGRSHPRKHVGFMRGL